MRRTLLAVAVCAGLLAATASPAAAATRVEYIAQVDPICQTFVTPVNDAFVNFTRKFKKMDKLARAVSRGAGRKKAKAFLKSIKKTGGALTSIAQLHEAMIAQIAAVPPPSDATVTPIWLDYLRKEQAAEVAASTALLTFKFRQAFAQLKAADDAVAGAQQTIAGFGFHVCGVSVT